MTHHEFGDSDIFSMGYTSSYKIGASTTDDPFELMNILKKYLRTDAYIEALSKQTIERNEHLQSFVKGQWDKYKGKITELVREAIKRHLETVVKQNRNRKSGKNAEQAFNEFISNNFNDTTSERSGILGVQRGSGGIKAEELRKFTRTHKTSGRSSEFVQAQGYLAEISARRTQGMMSTVMRDLLSSKKIFEGTKLDETAQKLLLHRAKMIFKVQVDHIIGQQMGGGDSFSNQQLIPARVNMVAKVAYERDIAEMYDYYKLTDKQEMITLTVAGESKSVEITIPFSNMKIVFLNVFGVYTPIPEGTLSYIQSKLRNRLSFEKESHQNEEGKVLKDENGKTFRKLTYGKDLIRASILQDMGSSIPKKQVDIFLENIGLRFAEKYKGGGNANTLSGEVSFDTIRKLLQGLFY